MQDEELDKLITDAANQHHPPYNNEDWDKMHMLLNEHLPQEKDRRRPLFLIIFLALLTTGMLTTAIIKSWKKNTKPTTIVAESASTAPEENKTKNKSKDAILNNDKSAISVQNQKESNTTDNSNTANNNPPNNLSNISYTSVDVEVISKKLNYEKAGKTKMRIKAAGVDSNDNADATRALSTQNTTSIEITDDIKMQSSETSIQKDESNKDVLTIEKAEESKTLKLLDSTNNNIPKDSTSNKVVNTAAKNKPLKGFSNNFAIAIAAGGDMSYVSLSNTGKLKTLYGLGICYSINKHFRISSSILVSNKIYSAKPSQYKQSSGSTYPNLQQIDAACKIYEIPLMVYYNFAKTRKHTWFAGTGISSLLMKKEVYKYINRYPISGQIYIWNKTVSNKNNHFLSVVSLSGGYQYDVNKRFSFMAEPYLKLPISGIGEGEVKLKSAGILFTAAFKPFKR